MVDHDSQSDPAKPGHWVAQGLRSALYLRPDFQRLQATPAVFAVLCVMVLVSTIGLGRLWVPGPAIFYWQALAAGWVSTVTALWVCWWALRSRDVDDDSPAAPALGALFGVYAVQSWLIVMATWTVSLMLGAMGEATLVQAARRWLTPLTLLWSLTAAVRLLWPHVAAGRLVKLKLLGAVAASIALAASAPNVYFWYPDTRGQEDGGYSERFELTQEAFEAQAQAFEQQRARLAAQRPGVIDLYAITAAPYDADVFLNESRLVADVMRTRFDAEGRVMQLVSHHRTATSIPWATPINLERAIAAAARAMDRDEDVLFLHLTSHGGRDAKLAAQFWPLQVQPISATDLKRWLDSAGVRFRVISVSACYAGSWIETFRDDHTLVMTAADAEHTSFGCGRGSELTYFGRAMYNEQLRRSTSFEAAHAAARPVIEQREQQAGKTDGYSNPQIHVGGAIRQHLQALQVRLDGRPYP